MRAKVKTCMPNLLNGSNDASKLCATMAFPAIPQHAKIAMEKFPDISGKTRNHGAKQERKTIKNLTQMMERAFGSATNKKNLGFGTAALPRYPAMKAKIK